MKLMFGRIKKAKLTLNLPNCQFAVAEVDYLGHHVGLGRVVPRAKKVSQTCQS